MAEINLSPYTAESSAIDRRRKMAELIQAQSMQPAQDFSYNGIKSNEGATQNVLTKMLQAWTGVMGGKKADQDMKALYTQQQDDSRGDMSAMVKALSGQAAQPERAPILDPQESEQMADQGSPMAPNIPAVAARAPGVIDPSVMDSMKTPQGQQMAMAQILSQLGPKAPIKLGKDDRLVSATTFQPVGPAPVREPKYHVVNGNLVAEPTVPGDQVKPAFTAPEKSPEAIRTFEAALTASGIDPKSPQGMALFSEFVKKQTSHPSAANVNVKTEVKTGESLAAQVGPMMKDSTTAAEGAVKQVDAARRIVQAVDTGKIITGPTADARLVIGQVGQVLGVGGKDEAEKIANTRQTIRGLAELTLQGRQQMRGQGAITESEGKLAERAMSGEINFTAAEIKQLAQASERSARFQYNEHTRKMKVMEGNPALQGIAPFYQGPTMPPEAAPGVPAKPGWSIEKVPG